ncbi:MAG: hypothetical protein LQ352_003091 [Teloschistes flavicans]|nr:MAG: hypothetical protein LQ352_003091 [Teloschistes flavicans]
MYARQANSPPEPSDYIAKVQRPVFLALIWTGAAVAIICCILRVLSRIRAFKKLFVDDYFVLLALSFTLTTAIMWQVYARQMYHMIAVSAGLVVPEENFPKMVESYLKSTLAVMVLFYSSLWSIKISFLLFFRRLGTNVRGQKLIWWPVFVITVATYFACIGDIEYKCFVKSWEDLATICSTPAVLSSAQRELKVNCAFDVITDCLIMLIPFTMLRGVQMRWRRKAALGGIFSLVIITMIVAIVRTALVASKKTKQLESSWLYTWSAIETSVAVIVACLGSFRNLFSRESNHNVVQTEAPTSSNLFLRGNGRRKKIRDILDSLASIPEHPNSRYQKQSDHTSDTRSIIDYHVRDAHHLDEMPQTV